MACHFFERGAAWRRQGDPEQIAFVKRKVVRIARQPITEDFALPGFGAFQPEPPDARSDGFIDQYKGIVWAEGYAIGKAQIVQAHGRLFGLWIVTQQASGGFGFPEIVDPMMLIEALRGIREPDRPIRCDVQIIGEEHALAIDAIGQYGDAVKIYNSMIGFEVQREEAPSKAEQFLSRGMARQKAGESGFVNDFKEAAGLGSKKAAAMLEGIA